MNINLQISDSTYRALVSGNARIKGSIGLVSPTEGNFNEHRRSMPKPGTRFIRLPHGRASVGTQNVRLTLNVNLGEAGIVPADVVVDESMTASDFIDAVISNSEF